MAEAQSMETQRVRIDKWLWAARFFKTRSLASQAVTGGKVQLNGNHVKPARDVQVGDEVSVRVAELQWVVRVRALSEQRRSAPEAQQLYEETAESREKREASIAERKARANLFREPGAGRPTKRDRRLIRRFTGDE
jgi:ribosome-associated heat shock protein Hsp15